VPTLFSWAYVRRAARVPVRRGQGSELDEMARADCTGAAAVSSVYAPRSPARAHRHRAFTASGLMAIGGLRVARCFALSER